MDVVDIARWQFAITTIYHFFFVPVTIGLSMIVACFETAWLRHRNPEMLQDRGTARSAAAFYAAGVPPSGASASHAGRRRV